MINIDTLTEEQFKGLPLVVEGESKEVRYAGQGKVVIRLKPTIYSFTANRAAVVPGSEVMRLRATRVLTTALKMMGVPHAYNQVNERWILADFMLQPQSPSHPTPFRDPEWLKRFPPVAPPIEVVVKRMHSGTSKHRYVGMSGWPVRDSHHLYHGMSFQPEGAYPEPLVRFDWRNPMRAPDGKWLADEVLGDQQANWFINVQRARLTALKCYDALAEVLNEVGVVLYDVCLFITEDGDTVFGEISQDCGRFRHFDHGSLDKDVWRAGGSSDDVVKKWGVLADLLEEWETKKLVKWLHEQGK